MTIQVLIIDDSITIVTMLSQMVEASGAKVVGTAKSADEGLVMAVQLKPDIITLDIEMPGKSGLQLLPYLLKSTDAAVIMCSTLTNLAATATLQALEKGAFDYIPKNDIGKTFTLQSLRERLQIAYEYVCFKRKQTKDAYKGAVSVSSLRSFAPKAVVIGVSTGGPAALHALFSALPVLPIPIVVVQHMPVAFVPSLAERIGQQSKHKTVVASSGHTLVPGEICFAPGDQHVLFKRQFSRLYCDLSTEPKGLLHTPSADVLFQTAAELLGKELLAVVLTGMGRDGAEGSKTVRLRGGTVIAESQRSCVVYGMPRAVIEARTANYEFTLQEMASAIARLVGVRTL